MKPNWRRDKRKPRPIDGICSISGCRKPSGVTYYIWPLCNEHHDYYADLEAPCVIKKILGIPLNEREKVEIERWFDGNKPRARVKPRTHDYNRARDTVGHGEGGEDLEEDDAEEEDRETPGEDQETAVEEEDWEPWEETDGEASCEWSPFE